MSESQLRQYSIAVGEKLKQRGAWITCAESCTGGGVAKAITDIAGSSAYFDRGYVTYSNAAKRDLLGVSEDTLLAHGAVSEEVVREMALGALLRANADFSLSISGIAGPGGGSVAKPVGMVWFGFASKVGQIAVQKKIFVGDRDGIRMQATVFVLQKIHLILYGCTV